MFIAIVVQIIVLYADRITHIINIMREIKYMYKDYKCVIIIKFYKTLHI